MLEKMLAFIRDNDLCVLATTDGQSPHASLMAYLPGDQGRKLYLITSVNTRKYHNITANPQVSLLIDDRLQGSRQGAGAKALTVGGHCAPLAGQEQEDVRAQFAQRLPRLAAIAADPAARVLEVNVRTLQLLASPTESIYIELP